MAFVTTSTSQLRAPAEWAEDRFIFWAEVASAAFVEVWRSAERIMDAVNLSEKRRR